MGKFQDLRTRQFGRLTVLERDTNKKRVHWLCKCECGQIVSVRTDQLIGGITKSCGCLAKEMAAMQGKKNFKDLSNQRFGKVVALYPIKQSKQTKYYWMCQCDCGNTTLVLGTSLTSNNTQSCGCIKSLGEANVKQVLLNNTINFTQQYSIKQNNHTYFYDFAIYDKENNLIRLIEFDGIQHFGRISGWFTEDRKIVLQLSDQIKNQYAIEHNIPLVRIPYTERDNITLDMLLGDKYLIKSDIEEAQET